MRDPEFTWRGAIYGSTYRRWQQFIHRYGWHHTREIGPLAPDGETIHRCDWCGVSRVETPMHVIARRIRATGSAQKNFKVSDTPPSGPEKNSGHSGTPDPPNNKEIA